MRHIDKLYDWLAQGPTPECDQAFAAALEHAEPPYFERIVAHLLQRDNEAAWAGLIANYRRLPPEVRTRLLTDAQHLRAGFGRALTAPDARTRARALEVLAEHPCPAVAFLLPDLLRDTSDDVRRGTAHALRRLAESVVNVFPAADWDQARCEEYSSARAEVARASGSALRSFDLHYRLEAVELGLWFARDLGDELWEALSNRRSQCGNVASQNLAAWSKPPVARFLLEGLTHRAWRPATQQILRGWATPPEIAAILRNTDLLADDQIRRRLGGLVEPAWFSGEAGDLSVLPAEVREFAPRWVSCLRLSKAEKATLLSQWYDAGDADVRRACLEAVAALQPPNATDRPAPVVERSESTPAETVQSTFDELAELWPACRDEILAADAELAALIRENLDVWRPQLIEQLGSSDPRNRLLGLRVVAGTQSGQDFRAELELLRDDPVETIRGLARRVLDSTSPAAPGPEATPTARADYADPRLTRPPPPDGAPGPGRAAVRQKLRATLTRLLVEGGEAGAASELIHQVRTLLRELSADSPGPASDDAARAEVSE